MSTRARVIAVLEIEAGEVVHVEMRQERDATPPAGVLWTAPRGLCKVLILLRRIVRMECQRTEEAARV